MALFTTQKGFALSADLLLIRDGNEALAAPSIRLL